MSMTFIHTADWQIGKPFGRLPIEFAPLVRDARLGAIDRIAAVAEAGGIRHVLVAGDVFDDVTVPSILLGQTLARMLGHPKLVWHLLPGNHDPAQPGSVWHALTARIKNHPGIRLHLTPQPVEIEPGVWLLPAPLKTKAMSTDPTAYMDTFVTPPGAIRIGIAHGSARGFGSMGDAQVPLDPARAALATLDYLALGDWHGLTRINDRTWYSGTPEPDGYRDNDPGYTLVVTITAAGAAPTVQKHRTADFTWLDRNLTIRTAADLRPLLDELTTLGAPAKPVLLALTLTGRVPLTETSALSNAIASLGALTRHLDLDQTAVLPSVDSADLAQTFSGGLAMIAATISERQTQAHALGDVAAHRIAGRALQMLVQMAEGSP